MRWTGVWIAVGTMLWLGGCGSSAPRRVEPDPPPLDLPRPPDPPLIAFPSVDEMERLAPQLPGIPPELLQGTTGAVVDRWEVTTPPAPGDQPYASEGPAEALLDEVAAGSGIPLRRSGSVRCAATEFARFQTEHGDHPFDWLTRHVLAACGSLVRDVSLNGLTLTASVDEERFVRNARAQIEEALRAALGPDRLVATAFYRGARKSVLIIAASAPGPLHLEPWHGPDADGLVRLRGASTQDLGEMRALITHGPHGVRACDMHRTLRSFAIDCPMAESDPAAQVEIFASAGEILLRQIAAISVERTPGSTPPFGFTAATDPAPLDLERVLASVNTTRESAGLEPLALSAASSAIHQRFTASVFGTPTTPEQRAALDRVALGLRAGHGVDGGLVRDAMSTWFIERGDGAEGRIVARVLSTAAGRLALMSAGRGQLAVGLLANADPPYVALMATGYMLHDEGDRARDADRVFERLTEERAIRGLTAPTRVPELPNLSRAARRVETGELTRDAALEQGLRFDLPAIGGRARSLTTLALSLDRFLVAPALLAPELSVGVVVARTPIEGSRWANYIIYFVITGRPGAASASE